MSAGKHIERERLNVEPWGNSPRLNVAGVVRAGEGTQDFTS